MSKTATLYRWQEALHTPVSAAWMQTVRQNAWQAYQDMADPLPPQRNLRKVPVLDREGLQVPGAGSLSATLNERQQSWQFAAALVQDNGAEVSLTLPQEVQAQGVILTSLTTALEQHSDLVQSHFGTACAPTATRAVALNAACWQGGLFLYVPKNVELQLPVYFLQSLSTAQSALLSRSLVVVERGAKVSLVLDSWSDGDNVAYVSDVLEVIAGDGAQVQLVALQAWSTQAHVETVRQSKLGRDAHCTDLQVTTGAAYHHASNLVDLMQNGANTRLLGLTLGSRQAWYRQDTLQNHLCPHTQSKLVYHSVLRDQAYSFYNGMIYVDKVAQQTESYQLSRNLLLSDASRADAIPNLEIFADDVQSGHGASIGGLDPDQRFYLMSRGFDRRTAEDLIVEGFMEEVILQLDNEVLIEQVKHHLAMYLLGQEPEEEA